MDIYHSSNLIETINEYGQLANFLVDTSLTQSDKAGLSPMIGCNPSTQHISTAATYATNALNAPLVIAGDRSGLALSSVATSSGINTAVPFTFCLPMLSGVVGVNASKMLPIGKLNAPIRMEMFLSANDDVIYYGASGAGAVWQVLNVEFVACYVEINDDSFNQDNDLSIPTFISTQTYRQASTFLPSATAGEFTCLVPFRCASLNALYARFRNYPSAVQGANATAAYRKSSSINPNFSQFYYRVGSSIYPNKPVNLINGTLVQSGAEAYAELMKSFHALSSTIGNSAIPFYQYNVATTAKGGWTVNFVPGSNLTTSNTSNNAFAIGLELQSFSNRNDTILSGLSTLNSQVFFTGTINSGSTAGFDFTVDFFSQMDMILIIENGIMSARF